MKTIILYSAIAITMILLLLGTLRLHPYYHLAKKQMFTNGKTTRVSRDTLKIAFIGDSWAAYHHEYDLELDSMFNAQGQHVHVLSIGNVGAKSKEIYQRLYSTTKPVLLEQPNYCIISAGINDAVAKLGKDYYVHHYMLILQQLLDLKIKPVVLEMPEVNYRAIAGREPWTMRMRHVLSSLMTGSELYGFGSYKTALVSTIKKADMQNRIVYIPADSWNPGGCQDPRGLYLSDETHLNAMGYEVLDSCIAAAILKDIGNK
jgi:lysophospholipase L1-like esterase